MDVEENNIPGVQEEETIDEMIETLASIQEESVKDDLALKVSMELLKNARVDDSALKVKEQCVYIQTRIYAKVANFTAVMDLLKNNAELFEVLPKARTAKVVRKILELVEEIPGSTNAQISLCRDIVAWCVAEKRTFLRQRIEGKLASLLLDVKNITESLQLINSLLKELKRLDDKQMLTEAHLTEARIYHVMENIPKAKAALTASRSAATSIYVVPLLQAELDEMSGILQCEDGDFVTAYSYFLEAFEAYDSANSKRAITTLKYMALCQILLLSKSSANANKETKVDGQKGKSSGSSSSELSQLFTGKYALKYSGADLEAMAVVAKAAQNSSLQDFRTAIEKHSGYLKTNDLIAHRLEDLYENMFESNLLKIIKPYGNVEIAHVAKLIQLPVHQVELKLSQMLLDNKFSGVLEQGKGFLTIYESSSPDTSYIKSLEIIQNLSVVVDLLSARAKTLHFKSGTAAPSS